MTKDEINTSLFDEVKRLRVELAECKQDLESGLRDAARQLAEEKDLKIVKLEAQLERALENEASESLKAQQAGGELMIARMKLERVRETFLFEMARTKGDEWQRLSDMKDRIAGEGEK